MDLHVFQNSQNSQFSLKDPQKFSQKFCSKLISEIFRKIGENKLQSFMTKTIYTNADRIQNDYDILN